MSESFGQMLRRLRIRAGMSQNALANLAGCDPAYVNRLERAGQIQRGGTLIQLSVPKRTIVCALGQAMQLDGREIDQLLYTAGLAPSTDWQTLAERYARQLEVIRIALGQAADEPIAIEQRRYG